MHLFSKNLSSLPLKTNLYEITESFVAVRLKNSTGLLLSLEKIVDDFYKQNELTHGRLFVLKPSIDLLRT